MRNILNDSTPITDIWTPPECQLPEALRTAIITNDLERTRDLVKDADRDVQYTVDSCHRSRLTGYGKDPAGYRCPYSAQ